MSLGKQKERKIKIHLLSSWARGVLDLETLLIRENFDGGLILTSIKHVYLKKYSPRKVNQRNAFYVFQMLRSYVMDNQNWALNSRKVFCP